MITFRRTDLTVRRSTRKKTSYLNYTFSFGCWYGRWKTDNRFYLGWIWSRFKPSLRRTNVGVSFRLIIQQGDRMVSWFVLNEGRWVGGTFSQFSFGLNNINVVVAKYLGNNHRQSLWGSDFAIHYFLEDLIYDLTTFKIWKPHFPEIA